MIMATIRIIGDSFYLWTDFSSSSETPINCRNLTVPRPVLNCSNWGSFKNWGGQKRFQRGKLFTFATSRCLNVLVPLSRGLDQLMWSPATSLFSDSKTYLWNKINLLFLFVCSTLLWSWAGQQARLGVDSDLALVSIYKKRECKNLLKSGNC